MRSSSHQKWANVNSHQNFRMVGSMRKFVYCNENAKGFFLNDLGTKRKLWLDLKVTEMVLNILSFDAQMVRVGLARLHES